jgi:hypothetical protein
MNKLSSPVNPAFIAILFKWDVAGFWPAQLQDQRCSGHDVQTNLILREWKLFRTIRTKNAIACYDIPGLFLRRIGAGAGFARTATRNRHAGWIRYR